MAFTDEELGQLLVNIAVLSQKLTSENFLKHLNGDTLSYTAVKLAAMKSSVMELKVAAHQHMLDTEIIKDREKALAYKRAMAESNATAAKDLKYADDEFIEAQQKYANAKVSFEQLKSVTADTHDLIESIRSRIIDLQSQRKDDQNK